MEIDFQSFIDLIESKSGSDEEIENKFKIEYLEMRDDWYGETLLHCACQYGRVGLVNKLIDNKCDINTSNKNGYQPIHYACEYGHIDIVKILIDNKCDINPSNNWGYQPIHLACLNGHIDIVKILIDNKCDINASNNWWGYQPIHLACQYGHIDIVKILIDNKCDINASNNNGYQPIHYACKKGHIDVVKILIDNKCDINASTNNGYQPIHLACENGHIDIVKILIDNKCNTKALTNDGKSPIDIARQIGYQQIIDIISVADQIESIIASMNLKCTINCDHKFCSETLKKEKLPKGKYIGWGSFGVVYKYKISNTNQEIVIKKTEIISEDKKNIETNINKFSSQIIHRNIVRYFGALKKSEKLYIFMEFISGGSLKDIIYKSGKIEINKVIQYSKQILVGLEFLHSKTIVHSGIKPENILLDHDDTVKLTDFGLSISLKKLLSESIEKAESFCGTLNYMAPEVANDEPHDYPADIWSTGATIIHMITGKMPYHNLLSLAVIFKIGTTKIIEFIADPPISETMQSFINDLLTPDQSKRPNATKLLNHSIFENI